MTLIVGLVNPPIKKVVMSPGYPPATTKYTKRFAVKSIVLFSPVELCRDDVTVVVTETVCVTVFVNACCVCVVVEVAVMVVVVVRDKPRKYPADEPIRSTTIAVPTTAEETAGRLV